MSSLHSLLIKWEWKVILIFYIKWKRVLWVVLYFQARTRRLAHGHPCPFLIPTPAPFHPSTSFSDQRLSMYFAPFTLRLYLSIECTVVYGLSGLGTQHFLVWHSFLLTWHIIFSLAFFFADSQWLCNLFSSEISALSFFGTKKYAKITFSLNYF
jgi:hypothetical protein